MLIHIFHDKMSDVSEVLWQNRLFVGKIGYLVGNYCTQTKARDGRNPDKGRSRAASTAATEQKRDKKNTPGRPEGATEFLLEFYLGNCAIMCNAVTAHSSPLLPRRPPLRSCACSRLLVVMRPKMTGVSPVTFSCDNPAVTPSQI